MSRPLRYVTLLSVLAESGSIHYASPTTGCDATQQVQFLVLTTTMLPLFDGPNKRKRTINLGGISSASSHDAVLQAAKVQRAERHAQKQQRDAALHLQAWWRGCVHRRRLREELRKRFDDDVRSVDAMRCLIILRRDEDRLALWSKTLLEMDEGE